MTYQIRSLLQRSGNGVTGPFSPVEFAKYTAKLMDEPFTHLARVSFDSRAMMNIHEPGEGFSGFDTLIMACKHSNDIKLTMWVDTGTGGLPVALQFASEDKPVLTPIYQRYELAKKLTAEQIAEIFTYVFDNFDEVMKIKDPAATSWTI